MLFGAYPIVFQQVRGWSAGIGGLPFLGVAGGMIVGIGFVAWANKWYVTAAEQNGGIAPPEARLKPTLYGSFAIPIGMFWFAWTNYTSIHWISPVLAGAPFGFGLNIIFLGITSKSSSTSLNDQSSSVFHLLTNLSRLFNRCLHHLCRLGTRSQHRAPVTVRRRIPLIYCGYVQCAWHPLGKQRSSFFGSCLCTVSFYILQIRSPNSRPLCVRGTGRSCHGKVTCTGQCWRGTSPQTEAND